MIELPESIVLSQQLNQVLRGRIIKKVVVDSKHHKFAFYYNDPKLYHSFLENKTVDSISNNGGQVEFFIEDYRLILSDGANMRYYPPHENTPDVHQLWVEFDDDSHLVVTIRMYGAIYAFAENSSKWSYYLSSKMRRNALDDEFNSDYFRTLISNEKKDISVKALLATEQRIPGLGNGVLQDILFQARIHPRTKISKLTNLDIEGLFWNIKHVLSDMVYKNGRNSETDIYGVKGDYQCLLSKSRTFCVHCNSLIIRESYLGGNIYYCPICQLLE